MSLSKYSRVHFLVFENKKVSRAVTSNCSIFLTLSSPFAYRYLMIVTEKKILIKGPSFSNKKQPSKNISTCSTGQNNSMPFLFTIHIISNFKSLGWPMSPAPKSQFMAPQQYNPSPSKLRLPRTLSYLEPT